MNFIKPLNKLHHRVSTLWENLIITFEVIRDNPKKSTTAVVAMIALASFLYIRVPQYMDCVGEAWYNQNIAMGNFDFKEFSGQCVVKRGDRWLPINRGIDAGVDGLE